MNPEVSYCSLVNSPPEQVAATLAPLRSLDPEVVLAVDDRVDSAWIDGYRQIADRVFLVSYPGSFARTYAWLREQCAGRWILQLDADEVPAPGLAAEVAATIAAGDVTHAWIRCRWLYPDAHSYLAPWPWRPDYSLRLLRNDPAVVRFPAQMHATVAAIGPKRYLREPLYHADLLTDVAARERKHARYEAGRPGFVIDGLSLNEVYYLPERRSDLRMLPVPEEDAGAVAAFLEPSLLPRRREARPPASVAHVALDEIVARSEHRELGEDDYRASLTLLDDDLRLVAREWRTFDVEVRNLGTTQWPGGLDARPQTASATAGSPSAAGTRRACRRASAARCAPAQARSSRSRCSVRRPSAGTRSRSTSCTSTCAGSAAPYGRGSTYARRRGARPER